MHGRHAIEITRTWCPDIILSDYDMAPVNGVQLLAHVRRDPRLARTPFIMVTAHIVRFADSGRDGGLTHYLAKPFKPSDLKEKMISVLAASRRLAA